MDRSFFPVCRSIPNWMESQDTKNWYLHKSVVFLGYSRGLRSLIDLSDLFHVLCTILEGWTIASCTSVLLSIK